MGTTWREVLALAERQDGVVGRAQLIARGVPGSTVDSWVRSGRLQLIFRGAYAVGHRALPRDGRARAAILACGPWVVLSDVSAARLHGLSVTTPEVHVSTRRPLRGQPGILVHRPRHLPRVDVTTKRGLPVTTVSRTLVDLAGHLPYPALRDLADEPAELDLAGLLACLERFDRCRGARSVRRLLAREEARTKSAFERRFARFCRTHRLPDPDERNRFIGTHKVDALYLAQRLAVELDGRAYHVQKAQMRADRRRDSDLQTAKWRVLRLVWEDLDDEWAAETAQRIRDLLALGGALVLHRPS